jgi:hypothetical protein
VAKRKSKAKGKARPSKQRVADPRVSLHPLKFTDAVAAILGGSLSTPDDPTSEASDNATGKDKHT